MKQAFQQCRPKEQILKKGLEYAINFCFFPATYLSSWPSEYIWVTSMAYQEPGY